MSVMSVPACTLRKSQKRRGWTFLLTSFGVHLTTVSKSYLYPSLARFNLWVSHPRELAERFSSPSRAGCLTIFSSSDGSRGATWLLNWRGFWIKFSDACSCTILLPAQSLALFSPNSKQGLLLHIRGTRQRQTYRVALNDRWSLDGLDRNSYEWPRATWSHPRALCLLLSPKVRYRICWGPLGIRWHGSEVVYYQADEDWTVLWYREVYMTNAAFLRTRSRYPFPYRHITRSWKMIVATSGSKSMWGKSVLATISLALTDGGGGWPLWKLVNP